MADIFPFFFSRTGNRAEKGEGESLREKHFYASGGIFSYFFAKKMDRKQRPNSRDAAAKIGEVFLGNRMSWEKNKLRKKMGVTG